MVTDERVQLPPPFLRRSVPFVDDGKSVGRLRYVVPVAYHDTAGAVGAVGESRCRPFVAVDGDNCFATVFTGVSVDLALLFSHSPSPPTPLMNLLQR